MVSKRNRIVSLLVSAGLLASFLLIPSSAAEEGIGPVSDATLSSWSSNLSSSEQWVMMEYLENQSGWTKGYDIIAQSGYLYNESKKTVISYETERSLDVKIDYINDKGLGGIIVWDSQGDNMSTWPMYTKMAEGLKENGKNVISYFGNWMCYGESSSDHTQGQTVDYLPWGKISCLNYSFFTISDGSSDGVYASVAVDKYRIRTVDQTVDFGPDNAAAAAKYGAKVDEWYYFDQIGKLAEYKAQYPDTRMMLSVGGWTRSDMFHEMCLTQSSRATFIDSCIDFLTDFPHFDGIDLDWEYPTYERAPEGDGFDHGNPAGPEDKENFTALCKEMREALDAAFPNEHKYITTCTASDQNLKLLGYELDKLDDYVDSLNIMTYDYYGDWDGSFTGYNSPIYAEDPTDWCVDNSVQFFIDNNVDMSKVNIGCPLYGFVYKNVEKDANGYPVGLPNPQVTGLTCSPATTPAGIKAQLDVKYTFTDGSARTPAQVHNPVTVTATKGGDCIDITTDDAGNIYITGLRAGQATLSVTAPLDNLSTTATVTVSGEIKDLEIVSLTSDKSTITSAGTTQTFTCTAEGGAGSYRYYFYVLKDGKVFDKVAASSINTFSFTSTEAGNYTIASYVIDDQNSRVTKKSLFTVS